MKKQKFIYQVSSAAILGNPEFFTSFSKAEEYVLYLEQNFYLKLKESYISNSVNLINNEYEKNLFIRVDKKQLNTFIK